MTAMAAVPWILVDFVLGLVVVWTYVAIRPRFGPGPKTALLAALVSFVSSTAVVSGFTSMGLMTQAAFVRGTLLAAVSMALPDSPVPGCTKKTEPTHAGSWRPPPRRPPARQVDWRWRADDSSRRCGCWWPSWR